MRGERIVVGVIFPPEPAKAPFAPVPEAKTIRPITVRRIVTWPVGKPLDWLLSYAVAPKRKEPKWVDKARKLQAAGWGRRRIQRELRVSGSQLSHFGIFT